MIRFAKLPIHFDANAIQANLSGFDASWMPHFNKVHYEGSWTALSLRSAGGDPNNIIPQLITLSGYLDTENMLYFPKVKSLLCSLNCEVTSVRLLNLQPGAFIKPHRDNELAFEKGEARLHFPILTNRNVEFFVENDRIWMDEGSCWYLNANLIHRVHNKGTSNRIHLVVDCIVNDWLASIITNSDELSVKDDLDSEEALKIIAELRLQNTAVTNRLANDMEASLKPNPART